MRSKELFLTVNVFSHVVCRRRLPPGQESLCRFKTGPLPMTKRVQTVLAWLAYSSALIMCDPILRNSKVLSAASRHCVPSAVRRGFLLLAKPRDGRDGFLRAKWTQRKICNGDGAASSSSVLCKC